jgi:hypothetical protein
MSVLPKIDVPIYELTLPLTKQKIKYRPFLVKEEKILLMAMEADDEKSIMDAIKQIVSNCILDDIKVDELTTSDLEFLFLNLRARSVGDVVDLQYKCNNKIKSESGEHECGNVMKFNIKLLDIVPEVQDDAVKNIKITDKLGIMMRYPTIEMYEKSSIGKTSELDVAMEILLECVDFVYDDDSVYYNKDIPRAELREFVENLTRDQFGNMQKFISSIPKLKKDLKFKCNKCGYEENIVVEGLQNFFV